MKARDSDAYVEYNFSPSFAWAAYTFDRYRTGMRPMEVGLDPEVEISEAGRDTFFLAAEFDPPPKFEPGLVNLAAVVEEADGTKSYWALAHPASGPPDFHDPACFVLELPPPSAP